MDPLGIDSILIINDITEDLVYGRLIWRMVCVGGWGVSKHAVLAKLVALDMGCRSQQLFPPAQLITLCSVGSSAVCTRRLEQKLFQMWHFSAEDSDESEAPRTRVYSGLCLLDSASLHDMPMTCMVSVQFDCLTSAYSIIQYTVRFIFLLYRNLFN